MKNSVKQTSHALAVFVLTWVLLMACQTGDSSVKPGATAISNLKSARCGTPLFLFYKQIYSRPGTCTYSPHSFCWTKKLVGWIPCEYDWGWRFKCPQCIKGNPWDIYRNWVVEPVPLPWRVMPDLRQWAQDPTPEPWLGAFFSVNEQVIGMQFYERMDIMDGEVLILKEDLPLDVETAKALGIQASVIPAGKYPVLIDPKSKTFNALLSVK